MARQLTFDLPVRTALGRGDFFVSPANALALAAVEAPASWPNARLLVIGPPGSGKTHLASVFAAETGAAGVAAGQTVVVPAGAHALFAEDIDRVAGTVAAEEALFHLLNAAQAAKVPLLLTATFDPAGRAKLPDLASRLAATQKARLDPPDDALLHAVMLKLFADRQLAVSPALIAYVVARTERSLGQAGRVVAALDQAALAEGGRLGRALAARILDKLADEDP